MSDFWYRLATRLVMPWVDRYRFHADTCGLARELEEREYWSPERLRQWQVSQLRPFLQHCYDHCPFYRRRFGEAGFQPRKFEHLSQLEVIPPLTKTDIRTNIDDLFSQRTSRRRVKKGYTGGSTGAPTPFYLSYAEAAVIRATTFRFMDWVGIQPGDRIARMGGLQFSSDWRSPLIRFYFKRVENTFNFPCPAANDKLLDSYIEKISSCRSSVVWGYPSALYLLASRMIEEGRRLPNVRRIWASSEILTDQHRETIREAFQADPFDMYGGGDAHVAGECEAHDGKHVVQHTRLVEIVDDEYGAVKPGQAGRVLVTSFFNYDWPYVRYEMGDLAEVLPDGTCSCGRRLPKIGRVLGRTGDYVVTRDGWRATIPNFSLIFAPIADQVQLYQIVQPDLDHVEARVVPAPRYGRETEQHIEAGLRRFLGEQIQIRVVQQRDVEQTRVGKRQAVISHLPNAA